MPYTDIKIGSRGRLAILKRNADRLNAWPQNARKAMGNLEPYTWRDVRYSGFHNARANRCELSPGMNGNQVIYYCHTGQYFPRECWADEIIPVNHQGWFSDVYGYETIRGLVVRLPRGRFLAGYFSSDNGEGVYYPHIFDCPRDAAYAADGYAQYYAELNREEDEKYIQAGEIENTIKEKENRLRECLALRNNPCFATLRDEARDLIKEIRDNRETLENEYADYAI